MPSAASRRPADMQSTFELRRSAFSFSPERTVDPAADDDSEQLP